MKRRALVVLVAALAGCGGTKGQQLFLAPNGDELHVKLQEIEPNPF